MKFINKNNCCARASEVAGVFYIGKQQGRVGYSICVLFKNGHQHKIHCFETHYEAKDAVVEWHDLLDGCQ